MLNRGVIYLALLSALLFLLPESLSQWLQFERAHPWQIWRWLTGHLLHSNAWHLLMNLLAFVVIGYLHHAHYSTKGLACFFLISGAILSACLLLFSSSIVVYVGLSGFLHALLAFGAVRDVQRRWFSGLAILAGLALKIGYEQFQGPDPDLAALLNADVAIDAHFFGALIGASLALLFTPSKSQTLRLEKKSGSA